MSTPRRLKCAETWSGNDVTATVLELPGLAAWVHSVAYGPGNAGGDVHYVSVCPSCLVTRVALADVSGHGRAVELMGAKLRELMQKYLTALEQAGLMRDLNESVRTELDGVHYATMVAVGFHERRDLLVLTNAGHPTPLFYQSKRNNWVWLDRQPPANRGIVGTPLGLFADAVYDRTIVKWEIGDLVVLYTDGVSEATNPTGDELTRDGLLTLIRQLDTTSLDAFGNRLLEGLSEFRAGAVPQDDETITVLQRIPTT
jgi:phosphoserine phosphatase RsbU/P